MASQSRWSQTAPRWSEDRALILTDLSVRRPVLATVGSLVILVLGVVSMGRLGTREVPDVD